MKDKELNSVEDVDLNILGVLSENSRENYNQIAQILKKSPVTVKKHVKN